MRKTLETILIEKGLSLHDCIFEENALTHTNTLKGNKVEARVILTFKVGEEYYEFNDVRTFTLKKSDEG